MNFTTLAARNRCDYMPATNVTRDGIFATTCEPTRLTSRNLKIMRHDKCVRLPTRRISPRTRYRFRARVLHFANTPLRLRTNSREMREYSQKECNFAAHFHIVPMSVSSLPIQYRVPLIAMIFITGRRTRKAYHSSLRPWRSHNGHTKMSLTCGASVRLHSRSSSDW